MASSQDDAVSFSIPLPQSLDTRIYARLSTQAKAILLSLTTATQDVAAPTPMGSFVYALPNVSATSISKDILFVRGGHMG